jgi:O-antigen/teichoic acid export membrane protein
LTDRAPGVPSPVLGIVREFALIAGGQSVAAFGGIVGVWLLTQALSPSIYGEVALGMTLALLVQQTLLSPLSVAFLRFFSPAREARTIGAYWKAVRRLLMQASIAVAILGVACTIGLVGVAHSEWVGVVLAATALSLFSGYNVALDNIQNAARHRLLVVVHQVANQWARFLVALALIVTFEKSSAMVLAAYALVSAATLFSRTLFLGKRLNAHGGTANNSPEAAHEMVARMRGYALPFATWGVFTWAFEASGRWALQLFSGTTGVGLYAALWQIGQYPIVLLADAIATTVAPIVFARAGDGSDQLRLKDAQRMNAFVVGSMFAITIVATFAGHVLRDRIVALVVGPEYRSIAPLLPWAILAGGLFGCAQVAVLRILMSADTGVLIAPKIGTAVAGVVLKVGGAYLMGLRGVVAASVIFSLMYLVWIVGLNRRVTDRPTRRPRWLGLGWGAPTIARKRGDAHPYEVDG